jgi:hypothetical protein
MKFPPNRFYRQAVRFLPPSKSILPPDNMNLPPSNLAYQYQKQKLPPRNEGSAARKNSIAAKKVDFCRQVTGPQIPQIGEIVKSGRGFCQRGINGFFHTVLRVFSYGSGVKLPGLNQKN